MNTSWSLQNAETDHDGRASLTDWASLLKKKNALLIKKNARAACPVEGACRRSARAVKQKMAEAKLADEASLKPLPPLPKLLCARKNRGHDLTLLARKRERGRQ